MKNNYEEYSSDITLEDLKCSVQNLLRLYVYLQIK